MGRKKKEKRREERIGTSLPVDLGGTAAVVRDVSASGVFFETDAEYAVGSPISFALNLDTPWGKVMIQCQGKIVRMESRDGKVGVAVQFSESRQDPPQ
jgi:hypothetical protein